MWQQKVKEAKIEMMILAFFYIIFYIGDGTVAVVVVVALHFVINWNTNAALVSADI